MDLSHNQRKEHTARVFEDLISATTYIKTPMRPGLCWHREIEELPVTALDRIWASPPPLNLPYLKHSNSYLCKGPEPLLCLWPGAN